ncbi:hypothetical protein CROQUDRAFT_689551 [Cronartium quercuum f. sp. fusiforme G11]|uniref:Secreted protein n=1 Tax=Cronartium quercuum f. sp. fusiforme G11 TaxID=708437 RepID=A0A9P6NS56_9BASI|nr:hypothetical protein CROQUDRAFT_689551 [Cronartium quercuum f. sp. fusiforme G11]
MKFLKTSKLIAILLCIKTFFCDASLVQFLEKFPNTVESSVRDTTHQQEYAEIGMYGSASSTHELGLWPDKQQKVWEDFEKVEKCMIDMPMKTEKQLQNAEATDDDARNPKQVIAFKTILQNIIQRFNREVDSHSEEMKTIIPTIKKVLLKDKTFLESKEKELTNKNVKTIVSELSQLLMDQYSTHILQTEMLKGMKRNPNMVAPDTPSLFFSILGNGPSQDTYGRAYVSYMKFSKRLNSILVAGLGDREAIQKLGPVKDGNTQAKLNDQIIIQAHNHRSIHYLLRNSYTDFSSMKGPHKNKKFSEPMPHYKALLLAEIKANDFLHSEEILHIHQSMCHILQGGEENAAPFHLANLSENLEHARFGLEQIHCSYFVDGNNFNRELMLIQYTLSLIDQKPKLGDLLSEMLDDLCKEFLKSHTGIGFHDLKARVRNLVMTFFLFREMGSILNKVTMKAKENGLDTSVLSVEQCMRYYWTFLRVKKDYMTYKVAQMTDRRLVNRLEFNIGAAYSNYLRDSQKMDQLKKTAVSSSPEGLFDILTHKPEEFPSFEQLNTNTADHYQPPKVVSTRQDSAKIQRSTELNTEVFGSTSSSTGHLNEHSHVPQPPILPTVSVDEVILRTGEEIDLLSSMNSEKQAGSLPHFSKICIPNFQKTGNTPTTILKNYQMNTKEKIHVPQTQNFHQNMVPVPNPNQEPMSQSLHTDARPVNFKDLSSNSYWAQSSYSPFEKMGSDESLTIPTFDFLAQKDPITTPQHVTLTRKDISTGKNLEILQVGQDFNTHGSLMNHGKHSAFKPPIPKKTEDQVKRRKLVSFVEVSSSAETSVAPQIHEAFNFEKFNDNCTPSGSPLQSEKQPSPGYIQGYTTSTPEPGKSKKPVSLFGVNINPS